MRACRTGANNENTLYDVSNATDYLGIHPKEGYVSTFRRYSFTEQMILADPKDKSRRWDLIKDESRVYVKIQIYEMLEPEDCHFYVSENKRTRQNSSQSKSSLPTGQGFSHYFPDIPEDSNYDPLERWSQEKNRLYLRYKHMKLWWDMPLDFSMEETHPDLFKLAEFVLLSPFDSELLDGWVPSRKPGIRPGLAFYRV